MKVSSVSALSFKAQPQQETQDKTTIKKTKNFVTDKRNLPYIASGAAIVAATVIGIIGLKRGWFKSAKNLERKGQELADGIKNPKAGHDMPKPESATAPHNTEVLKPKENPVDTLVQDTTPVEEFGGLHTEFSVVDDSELLEANIAHVDVGDEYIPSEIIRQTKNYEAPSSLILPVEDDVAAVIENKTIPLTRIMNFLKDVDNKAETQICSLNEQYPIINNINSGYRRYKKDFIDAFDRIIEDPNSGYKGSYKVVGNTIHELREDGTKVMYIFDKGSEGGLRFIREIPPKGKKISVNIEFAPELYWDLGNGIGIHRQIKMEYKNTDTKKVIETITIDPEKRDFHNIVINNPKTGKPVMSVQRTAEPDHIYYLAQMYDAETGELIARVNTKNNFGIAKVSETSPKVAKIS